VNSELWAIVYGAVFSYKTLWEYISREGEREKAKEVN
jgi:hypothetical protein